MLAWDGQARQRRCPSAARGAPLKPSPISTPLQAGDLLLNARDGFERQLEPQIAAGHHHRIASVQDLVQVVDRLVADLRAMPVDGSASPPGAR